MALLVLFSLICGFAGGHSTTWGGMIKEMEKDAANRNEAIDTGMVYGLLNGARGVGLCQWWVSRCAAVEGRKRKHDWEVWVRDAVWAVDSLRRLIDRFGRVE